MKERLELVYQYFPRLVTKRNVLAGFASGGEQQMTVIGRALMAQPRLMLLDEPSMGLAPLLIKEIFDIITRLNKEEGIPILLVEQNVKLALTVCSLCLCSGKWKAGHAWDLGEIERESRHSRFLSRPLGYRRTEKFSSGQTLQKKKKVDLLIAPCNSCLVNSVVNPVWTNFANHESPHHESR